MGAPNPLITVEPLLPASCSHPGPVYEFGEGVFQPVLAGKYASIMNSCLPVTSIASSQPISIDTTSNINRISNESTSFPSKPSSVRANSPGCMPASLMEAPNPLITVEPHLPASCSHPGPVHVFGEGVFQSVLAGKYSCKLDNFCPVTSVASSHPFQIDHATSSHCDTTAISTIGCTAMDTPSCSDALSSVPLMDRKANLSVYYQNVRGLRTKIPKLRLMLSSCDYDVLVFTETWLQNDIDSAEISSEYTFFRCDRSTLTSKHSRGGGVLIAVKHHYRCEQLQWSNCNHLEQVGVSVRLGHRWLHIVTIYLPPKSHADLYSAHANAVHHVVSQASDTDIVLSVGDFNLPNLRWHLDDVINGYIPSNISCDQESALIESIFSIGLQQVNSLVNMNGKLLDLVFVSLPEQLDLLDPPTPLLPIDNHHAPFVMLFDWSDDNSVEFDDDVDSRRYDFHKCDFNLLKTALSAIDWNSILHLATVDESLKAFYDKLLTVCDGLIPRKCHPFKSVFNQPWWTTELRNLRNVLRKARHRFFLTKLESDRVNLREVEATYKASLISTYEDYLSTIQANVKQNPSRFWDFVKKQKSSARIPHNVSYDKSQANSNAEAADLFAMFFESVFSNSSPVPRRDCFAHILSHNINIPIIQFSSDEVLSAIEDLDTKKGPGTDDIPPLLLKNCSVELASPIASLFNQSLRERCFPATWKTAFIIPIHKSGNINNVSNYRGVSILCSISKLFEKLMHNVVYTITSPLISDSQHGFMRRRSTTTNLMCYVTTLTREMEGRRQVDAVYIDFAKAFDTVPHILIVEKLRLLGFPDWITDWINSYLTGRNAFVVVNSARSRSFNITSGVPQGSILGPLLFNIFLNDLCSLFSSFKLSFADDMKLFRAICSPADCASLQEDVNTLLLWCSDNGMRVNKNKCKVISFTRLNSPVHYQYNMDTETLERVTSICDLGVTFDEKLTFNEHVGIMTAKAFSVLGFIRRHAAEFTDIYALKTLYCSLVRSILEYASPIWSPYYVTHIVSIERVQKKFIRFALRSLPWNDPNNLPPYPERCQLISLEQLSTRRVKMQQLFIFDIIAGTTDCPELLEQIPFNVPPRRFRNSTLLAVPYHRTNYGYNNPLDSCLRSFNNVCAKFDFDMSKNVFKKRIS